jgi:alkaline phosphatase
MVRAEAWVRGLARGGHVAKRIAGVPIALALACSGGEGAAPDATLAERRVVILFIGDGMGPEHMAAAGELAMSGLPHRGRVITASLSGTTDSAAAATTLASGVATLNGAIGVDEEGAPVETLIERARAAGLATGVVTTSSLSHATPGAFTAHRDSRALEVDIAADQALVIQPEVMLGGGAAYYLAAGEEDSRRDDGGLIDPLRAAGYFVVTDRDQLAAASGDRVLGLFAPGHLTYSIDRAAGTGEPTLAEMTSRALAILDRDPDGFFLLVEGARIDMASHVGDLPRAIGETRGLDEAVAAAAAWAGDRADVTILVTADHECGGLASDHTWKWGRHTSAPVELLASGPGAELVAGQTVRHADVHALLASLVDGVEPTLAAPRRLLPDGWTDELRHLVAEQAVVSGFGAEHNRLDALRLDADPHALLIGIDGLFQWQENAVVILLDVDPGAGTGPAALRGALDDRDGRIDAILSALPLDAPALPGFGADLAVVVWGGSEPPLEEAWGDAGLRGLRPPFGNPDDLGWSGVAVAFAGSALSGEDGASMTPGRGLELRVPWAELFPGGVPDGARLGVAAVLVSGDGSYLSNQALPPFPAGTGNPGEAGAVLPGVVEWSVP